MLLLQFKEIRRELDHYQKQHEDGKITRRKAIQELKAWMAMRQAQDREAVTKLFEQGWLE